MTKTELSNQIEAIIRTKSQDPCEDKTEEFKVTFTKDDCFIECSAMYNRPQISFQKLVELSELLGTKSINLRDGYSREGCHSCDYGSSYAVEIHIWNLNLQFTGE